ncbi:Four F5 protein [Tolypocladium capitatum]|uniref:Four F5 protein n=1 Tax=Tolypocladium capitatum TaxID=45235 RepID=A0A2K3QJY0_9HYPO|nr:Four F5 protein [Tolypocladium capitatum]
MRHTRRMADWAWVREGGFSDGRRCSGPRPPPCPAPAVTDGQWFAVPMTIWPANLRFGITPACYFVPTVVLLVRDAECDDVGWLGAVILQQEPWSGHDVSFAPRITYRPRHRHGSATYTSNHRGVLRFRVRLPAAGSQPAARQPTSRNVLVIHDVNRLPLISPTVVKNRFQLAEVLNAQPRRGTCSGGGKCISDTPLAAQPKYQPPAEPGQNRLFSLRQHPTSRCASASLRSLRAATPPTHPSQSIASSFSPTMARGNQRDKAREATQKKLASQKKGSNMSGNEMQRAKESAAEIMRQKQLAAEAKKAEASGKK